MTTAYSRNFADDVRNPLDPSHDSDNPAETITVNRAVIMKALNGPIAYYKPFAHVVGDVCAGVFLSQMFYWHDKGHDPDGWVYKTQKEIEDETGMTRYNQETARRKLVALGILEETRKGLPATMHFRLDLGRLFALMEAEERPLLPPLPAPSSSMAQPANPVCDNPTNKNVESPQSSMGESTNLSLYTETTPETTSQNTNNNNEPAAPSLSSSVLVKENEEEDSQEEQPLQPEDESSTPSNMDLNSLCEEHGVTFETLCAVLDLYETAAGSWPELSGIQAIVIWMAVHGTELVRESVRELQTALLTREIRTDPLRYLGGIIKHKSEEVEAEEVKATSREGGYTVPDEYAGVVIG